MIIDESDTGPGASRGEVVNVKRYSSEVFILEIAISLASSSSGDEPDPGQFFMLYPEDSVEHLLGRPLSVFDSDISKDQWVLDFLVKEVGWGTRKLGDLDPGEDLRVMGPLGRGFSSGGGRALLVSGGMGIAPLHYLARTIQRSGCDYTLLAGFSSSVGICAEVVRMGGELEIYTEDGSEGRSGVVTEGVGDCLSDGVYEAIYCCGPLPMMSCVSGMAREEGIPCQVSLENRMGCGMGLCRSCVVEGTDGKNMTVCRDGPVFDSAEIDWEAIGECGTDRKDAR